MCYIKDKIIKVNNENEILQSAAKELSTTFLHGKTKGKEDLGDVQKLISLLEKKFRCDSVENMKSVGLYEDFSSVNMELKKQINDITEKYEELAKERKDYDKRVEDLLVEVEKWKIKALSPRKRIIEIPENLRLGDITDIASVVEQLIKCIQDAEIKNKEVDDLKDKINKHQEMSKILIGQQRLLYKDYYTQKQNYETEMKDYKIKIVELNDKIKIQDILYILNLNIIL